jgi:hypothetical protein
MNLGLKKNLNVGLTAILAIAIVFVLYRMAKADYSVEVPVEKECPPEKSAGILRFIKQTESADVVASFPYKSFLDSSSFCNIRSIQNDLSVLDSCFKSSPNVGLEIYIKALTEKLEERISPSFVQYNPDSLIALVRWTEKFDCYKDVDELNARAYKIIYRHWMNFVSNHLGKYYEANSSIKYDFKFRYLTAICQSKKFSPPLGDSNTEKVVTNLIDQKWAYLFNRFWDGTGLVFKLLALIGLMVTLYGFFCIFKTHSKK